MLWVKIGTHIVDHERLLEAGVHARDLWTWGMLHAGKHETNGELPMAALLATAWGAGMKANIKPALRLVEVGLWERTDRGFRILRWAEQGNESKESLAAKRQAGRARKARFDIAKESALVTRYEQRSNAFSSTSTSHSLSGSDLGSEIASPPDWWEGTLATVEMTSGVALPAGEAWLRYSGHRAGKGLPCTARDAGYWLTSVMVGEARKDREAKAHREQRDRDFDAARRERKVDYTPKYEQPTAEQSRSMVAAILGRKVGT